MSIKLTRSGYIKVRKPDGTEHSQHVQEREAVESSVNLAMETGESILIDYAEHSVLVEVTDAVVPEPPEPPPDPTTEDGVYAVGEKQLTPELAAWHNEMKRVLETDLDGSLTHGASIDDMRVHNSVRDPLSAMRMALVATKDPIYFHAIDRIFQTLRTEALGFGYRRPGVDCDNSDYTFGDHDISTKLLIFVYNRCSGSRKGTAGTDHDWGKGEARYWEFMASCALMYSQNLDVEVEPYDRPQRETDPDLNIDPLEAKVERTGRDRLEFAYSWLFNHQQMKWNARLGRERNAPAARPHIWHHGNWDGVDSGGITFTNYVMWKLTGETHYEDAAKRGTDMMFNWVRPLVGGTDMGRPGMSMLRAVPDAEGALEESHARPTSYMRETYDQYVSMKLTGWYRWGTAEADDLMAVMHNTFSDHMLVDEAPDWGTSLRADVNGTLDGKEINRDVMLPDGSEFTIRHAPTESVRYRDEGIYQTFGALHWHRMFASPHAILLPWRTEGEHEDRFRNQVIAALHNRFGESGPMLDPGSVSGHALVAGLMLDSAMRGV